MDVKTLALARKIIIQEIAKITESDGGSISTLKEVIDWINKHPEIVESLVKDIDKIKEDIKNMEGLPGPEGPQGANGKSAFELAQEDGFEGTLTEWLDSLVGPQGNNGYTPEIGDNGNWFINGVDTNITALGSVISYTHIDENGHLIIEFADGSTLNAGIAIGEQGPQGIQGKPFTIAKTYSSIEEMNNDFENEEIDSGAFVIIVSETNDEDNAKLYVKGETSYTYVVDLSGMQGIQGEQGPQGKQGKQGETGPQGPAGQNLDEKWFICDIVAKITGGNTISTIGINNKKLRKMSNYILIPEGYATGTYLM